MSSFNVQNARAFVEKHTALFDRFITKPPSTVYLALDKIDADLPHNVLYTPAGDAIHSLDKSESKALSDIQVALKLQLRNRGPDYTLYTQNTHYKDNRQDDSACNLLLFINHTADAHPFVDHLQNKVAYLIDLLIDRTKDPRHLERLYSHIINFTLDFAQQRPFTDTQKALLYAYLRKSHQQAVVHVLFNNLFGSQ